MPMKPSLPPSVRSRSVQLLPLLLSALLTACTTTGILDADGTPAASPTEAGRVIRPAGAEPNWKAVRTRLLAAIDSRHGIEIGAADKRGLKVQIPVAEGFASGSSEIRPSLAAALDVIAPALVAEPAVAIQVIGHTDSQGSEMVNLRLSISRAEAVVEELRKRGVGLERMSADGRGEDDPLTSNATEAGRARNRRVELVLHAMP